MPSRCHCLATTCAVEDCGRPCHGGSTLCARHKVRRMMGLPLGTIRHCERDPQKMITNALEAWYEDLARRRLHLEEQQRQLDKMATSHSALAQVRAAQIAVAEAGDDDLEWHRANERLRQALVRYARSANRTPKHKAQARGRR